MFVSVPPNRFYIGLRYSPASGVYQWGDGSQLTSDPSPWLPFHHNQNQPSGPNEYCAFMSVQETTITNFGPYYSSLSRQSCNTKAHYICQRGVLDGDGENFTSVLHLIDQIMYVGLGLLSTQFF